MTAWQVTAEDWEHHRRYDDWLLAYEEAFERTETEWGPWTIVEATDRRFTWVKIYRTIIDSLADRLEIDFPSLPTKEEPGLETGVEAGVGDRKAIDKAVAEREVDEGLADIDNHGDDGNSLDFEDDEDSQTEDKLQISTEAEPS
jgi:hypothetical protein